MYLNVYSIYLDIQVYYLDIQVISTQYLVWILNYEFFYTTCLYKPLS